MEGKEIRFGEAASALFAASTTVTSTGAVNSMHDSLTAPAAASRSSACCSARSSPGGVGSGLYGMVVLVDRRGVPRRAHGRAHARVPRQEDRPAARSRSSRSYVLTMPAVVLIGTAIAISTPAGLAGQLQGGPHGLSEIVYAFASAGNNNGSAFGGLTSGTPFYNTLLGLAMLVGRFVPIALVLALAGRLAQPADDVPEGAGTLPDAHAAVRRPARDRDPRGRRPHVRPRPVPRSRRGVAVMSTTLVKPPDARRPCVAGAPRPTLSVAPARGRAARRPARPRPAHAVGLPRACSSSRSARRSRPSWRSPTRALFAWSITVVAVGDGAVRDPRRAVAEGRGKAQAASLRGDASARPPPARSSRLAASDRARSPPRRCASATSSSSSRARRSPATGTSSRASRASTSPRSPGESAPVIRESGGDRSAVTGGTVVLSDRIVVRITAPAGAHVRRPDDRAGRGLGAAEDAQRGRAQRAAHDADHHLPAGGRHPAAVRRLLRARRSRSSCSWRCSSA